MTGPMRALTGLGAVGMVALQTTGKPMEIPVTDILPDPANPRDLDLDMTPAAVEAQERLNEDVAERGIKTAISVHPHPTLLGKYVINYGHRRYRAAVANSLRTVPAIIDEKFDTYDQVAENELREGLSTRSRALFIKSRLDAGDSKGEIARRMRRKNQNFITEHLAIIDAPDCVNLAYANGVTSPRSLYDLRLAWEKHPEQVDAWVRSGASITIKSIQAAITEFRSYEMNAVESGPPAMEPQPSAEFRSYEKSASDETASNDARPADQVPPLAPDASTEFRSYEKPASASRTERKAAGEPGQPRAPLAPAKSSLAGGEIIVEYKGRQARIAPDTTVKIVVDGLDTTVEVLLSELVFKGAK